MAFCFRTQSKVLFFIILDVYHKKDVLIQIKNRCQNPAHIQGDVLIEFPKAKAIEGYRFFPT